MKETIPELISATTFEPADLEAMQEVFLAACAARNAQTRDHRAAIAVIVLDAYSKGERDRQKLLDAALAAAL